MSTNEKSESTTATAEDAIPAAGYTAAAQERIRELRLWREQIPRFVIPETTDATQKLSNAASVPVQFIELTNVAIPGFGPAAELPTSLPARWRRLRHAKTARTA